MRHAIRWLAPVLLAVALPAVGFAAKADVEITNRADWEIHHFYVSSADEDTWGPDQLDGQVIGKDESFTLKQVPCDQYDVKLVDEEGDECVIGAVDICGKSQAWVITSQDLLACQGATAGE